MFTSRQELSLIFSVIMPEDVSYMMLEMKENFLEESI